MVGLGRLGVDGTKVRANASRRKAMSYGRMKERERQLKAEIDELLKKARREDRLTAIEAAKQRLEAAKREADDERGRKPGQERDPKGGRPYKRAYGEVEEKAQSNFTDPESRIMKTSTEGFQQCYNAQVAVDEEEQIIVATGVTAQASDQGQMMGLLEAVEESFEETPGQVLADAGYCNEADLQALGHEGKQAVEVNPGKYPAKSRMRKKLAGLAGQAEYRRRKVDCRSPPWVDQGGAGISMVQSAGLAVGSRCRGSGTWCVWPSTSNG
jgi:hypothetical protein